MFNQNRIWGSLAGIGFLLSLVSGVNAAEIHPKQTAQFQRIEQPLAAKAGVTLGGLGLIGLELWWFVFSKTKSREADSNQGVQEVTITVDGGYEPARVIVSAGKLVRLNFMRRDRSSCLEKIVLPDFQIAQNLVLDRITSVEFTPQQPGNYTFTCGMNMFRGVIEVQNEGV
ncbi:cupredoxin domain-containing protein [Microcoleus sp. FACHB-672]|uniref:cupredoxin domain-containing protein n=1 Tax=Microcoleus sp. FACHB-672 TaxID=2692825 RepID=UPI001683464E|nr:cupredoxin domain-containing protein [Microcoleus sp. FACHB-672]MBD2041558.1 cupredoxin domain-containing protein [Microcoleus sp. FACHB-672]